jgi:hypothetical protein
MKPDRPLLLRAGLIALAIYLLVFLLLKGRL